MLHGFILDDFERLVGFPWVLFSVELFFLLFDRIDFDRVFYCSDPS